MALSVRGDRDGDPVSCLMLLILPRLFLSGTAQIILTNTQDDMLTYWRLSPLGRQQVD